MFDFLGLGAGKIDLNLNKLNFSAGETIDGEVILTLKKPVTAKRVYVKLFAHKEIREVSAGKRRKRIQTIFEFKQDLDGEKEYPAGTPLKYPFSLKVPAGSSVGIADEGIKSAIGAIAQVANVFGTTTSTQKWYVEARLDLPMKFDVSKKIQINVG